MLVTSQLNNLWPQIVDRPEAELAPPGLDDPSITMPIVIVSHGDGKWFKDRSSENLLSISFTSNDQDQVAEMWGKSKPPVIDTGNAMHYAVTCSVKTDEQLKVHTHTHTCDYSLSFSWPLIYFYLGRFNEREDISDMAQTRQLLRSCHTPSLHKQQQHFCRCRCRCRCVWRQHHPFD